MITIFSAVKHHWRSPNNNRQQSFGCYRLAVLLVGTYVVACLMQLGQANYDERNLVEELFERQNYNPLIRPVQNLSQIIEIGFEMTLIQLIMLDERNQIMKTNIWLRLKWQDYQLQWDKSKFGGISVIRIQPDHVWKPDIVLFNNADGKFEVSFKANVLISDNGGVMWIPCAIYKSSCDIDVKNFPFDEQSCEMIFGSWTYGGDEVMLEAYTPGFQKVDLTDYEKSGSWDVYDVHANLSTTVDEKTKRTVSRAKYTIYMRRKTLFYTINLIIPSVLVSSLSMIVFYLPATAGERITMSISILLALVVFLQLLVTNILPPSSISLPLYAKYLLFTVIIDVCCISNTVIVLNWNQKTPRTHRMPTWVRVIFLDWMPRILFMQRPNTTSSNSDAVSAGPLPSRTPDSVRRGGVVDFETVDAHHPDCPYGRMTTLRHRLSGKDPSKIDGSSQSTQITPEINKAIEAVRFVGAHLKNEDDFEEVVDDWRYVSLVIDRTLFFIYMIVSVITTCTILIKTPIFDTFNQADYKTSVSTERYCRDSQSYSEKTPYDKACAPWYPELCQPKWERDFVLPCSVWNNETERMRYELDLVKN